MCFLYFHAALNTKYIKIKFYLVRVGWKRIFRLKTGRQVLLQNLNLGPL